MGPDVMELRASGPVPPDEVWERYARPDRWVGWSPQIRRVDCPVERLVAGAAGRVHSVVPRLWVDFVVDTWDEAARTWSWTVRRGPLRLHLEHGVTARDGVGSGTWLRVHGPLPVVLGYLPLARLALHRLVHRP